MFNNSSSNTNASTISLDNSSQPSFTVTSSAPISELTPNTTEQISPSTEPAHGSPLSKTHTNASHLLRKFLHAPSPSLHPSPMRLCSPSLSDVSAVPSPAFSTISLSSSAPNSPLPTPDPRAQTGLALHPADDVVIESSPMALLEELPGLASLNSPSNLWGLDGADFPAPKEQAVVVKSHNGDASTFTTGANSGSVVDPAVHTFQLTMTREHVESLLKSLRGSSAHVSHDNGHGFATLDLKLGPIALNIRQGPE